MELLEASFFGRCFVFDDAGEVPKSNAITLEISSLDGYASLVAP